MRSIIILSLTLVLNAAVAMAAGYDDFADGMTAIQTGDSDRAISLFTSALAAGDLNSNLVPVAYYQRARAHLAKQNCAAAVADLSAAMKLRANYLEAIEARAFAQTCIGDYGAALVDYNQAIALKPNAGLFFVRGQRRWDEGDFAGASEDFAQSLKLSGRFANPYHLLWFAMARQRAGLTDNKPVEDAYANMNFDFDHWPGPLIELFRGKAKIESMAAAASDRDTKVAVGQRCEADFYSALWWIQQKNVDAAKPLLHDAAEKCPVDFIESGAAKRELARLSGSEKQ